MSMDEVNMSQKELSTLILKGTSKNSLPQHHGTSSLVIFHKNPC